MRGDVEGGRAGGVIQNGLTPACAGTSDEGVTVEAQSGSVRQVAAELAQAIKESSFRHGRSGALTEQVLAMRVADGVDGVRVVSKERADAVKAAVWAVKAALDYYDVLDSIG